MMYTSIFAFIIACMCISTESHDCDDRPVIAGADSSQKGYMVSYECVPPNLYHSGEKKWNCVAKRWIGKSNPFACTIDGGWSTWGDWSNCPATCGAHSHTRIRTCSNPASAHGGEDCNGPDTETEICSSTECPVDGGWSTWGDWSNCPATCGVHSHTRIRTCSNPASAHGGEDCNGPDTETEICSSTECPVDGGWSTWGDWSNCPATCGAHSHTRIRTCSNPASAHGGEDCNGPDTETEICSSTECPVDGGWSTWGDWSNCPATCGAHSHTRIRTCSNPASAHGGEDCNGPDTETEICSSTECPVDGGWSTWGYWSNCPATCGVHTHTRIRTCSNPAQAHGGADCSGAGTVTETCVWTECPVDGGWSAWGDWSICPGTCGIHLHSRDRTCSNPAPAHGGADCSGSNAETETCMLAECSGWCTARWTKVYEHNVNGQRVSGDKAELLDAVQQGAEIRLGFGNYFTSIQNSIVTANDDVYDVCAQALFHISTNGYNRFQNNAYWYFVNTCTLGTWNAARYYVGEHLHKSSNVANAALTWFVRSKCNAEPAFEVSSEGAVLYGSVEEVIKGVKSGAGLRIRQTDSRYTFPVDNVRFDEGESLVSGQALWHLSQHMLSGYYVFQSNVYWFFTLTSTDGEQEITRWNVGEHEHRSDTSRSIGTSWFLDTCWEEVYRHDGTGTSLSGSFTALNDAVLAGHKVKIAYDDYSIEADEVWVRYGKVYAMLVSSLTRDGIKYFDSNVNWNWQIASTDGAIETIRYLVGENTEVGGTTTVQKEIKWYVDVKEWSLAVSVNQAGTVVSGAKAVLEHAARDGADVRLAMRYDEIPNYTMAFGADNLKIDGSGEIGAMHLRSMSASFSGSALNFQTNPYWDFNIVTTTGRLEISQWTVGAHENQGRSNRQVNVDFFICK